MEQYTKSLNITDCKVGDKFLRVKTHKDLNDIAQAKWHLYTKGLISTIISIDSNNDAKVIHCAGHIGRTIATTAIENIERDCILITGMNIEMVKLLYA